MLAVMAVVQIALFASGCKDKPNAFAPSDDEPARECGAKAGGSEDGGFSDGRD